MSACKYGDPTCPCQDGDPCHYEGDNPMLVRPEYVLQRIADLERELNHERENTAPPGWQEEVISLRRRIAELESYAKLPRRLSRLPPSVTKHDETKP